MLDLSWQSLAQSKLSLLMPEHLLNPWMGGLRATWLKPQIFSRETTPTTLLSVSGTTGRIEMSMQETKELSTIAGIYFKKKSTEFSKQSGG